MIKILNSRNNNESITPQMAIINGLGKNEGLYTPIFKDINIDIKNLLNLNYQKRAEIILGTLLYDYQKESLQNAIKHAYDDKFSVNKITPIKTFDNANFLELYHGPTNAFKDIALSILPYLLKTALKDQNNNDPVFIMTATSGDTGKAAIEAFKGVEGTYINVLYPNDGVSDIQKLQMETSIGENVDVLGVNGNFDDCQRMVKNCNVEFKKEHLPINFSSANSINYGRLIPQVVYYFDSYCQMLEQNKINLNEEITFIVPTGNFGNILAGYIAKKMGCPIKHLVCASNENDVLVEFINNGIYNANRDFHKTLSPSMDILISSNLERLLFMLLDGDSETLNDYMKSLKTNGFFSINQDLHQAINSDFIAYKCDDTHCLNAIKECFDRYNYLIDPHTACGYHSYKQYQKNYPDTKCMILATASAYKFAQSTLKAFDIDDNESAKIAMHKLSTYTKTSIPDNLKNLFDLKINYDSVVNINELANYFESKIKEIIND